MPPGSTCHPAASELAARRGLPGASSRVPSRTTTCRGAPLDAVTLWQVLEHIGEPLPLLRRVRSLLKPGGLLVASVPNIEGLSAVLTQERWWGLDVPRHLVHYTPHTLRRAVSRGRAARGGRAALLAAIRSVRAAPQRARLGVHAPALSSDLAKSQVGEGMGALEYGYNLNTRSPCLAPMLAPLSLLATTAGAAFRHGGFIEVIARRP